jgi:hypothetical protein
MAVLTKYTMRQGESKAMEIPVVDENGVAIDISTPNVTNIIVTLSNNTSVIAKYSLNSMGLGWGTLLADSNIVTILATREQTSLWETGYVKATVTVEFTDLTLTYLVDDFENTTFLQIYPSINAQYTLIH